MTPETREQLVGEVRQILAEADAEIAARRPVCRASGRCCRFEEYGHRLYVTAAEAAYFAALMPEKVAASPGERGRVSLPQFFAQAKPEGCPYQVDHLCTAREARPLGCRVYFCDENAQNWQNDLYERYHARLRELHERLDIPYRYIEWRAALREMMETGVEEPSR